MTKALAIYHTWPDLKNAEYEVLQRIIGAAKNISAEVVLIDNSGIVLWTSQGLKHPVGKEISRDIVQFAISLHFESPRTCDIYTYYALWQPIKFYHDFGYQVSIDKLSTHNDVLSCHSDIADAHALNIFSGLRRAPIAPFETLFHTLPEPFLEPNVRASSKLFYVGINWERIGRPKGRYHDTLVMLDRKELIEIYGPEEIHGVAPWDGFKTYQGELPFDGRSVQHAINGSGICLALSSEAHKSTGIMSNRLFEGFASGAAVIATPNPLIDKYFSHCVYLVDDERGEAALGQQILSALREIRANPEEATRRVLEGQRILREVCSLERSLEGIFARNDERKAHFSRTFLNEAEVTVILDVTEGNLRDIIRQIDDLKSQVRSAIELHIICSDEFVNELPSEPSGSLRTIEIHARNLSTQPVAFDGIRSKVGRVGPIISRILKRVTTPYFALLGPSDRLFSEHFASSVCALQMNGRAQLVACGTLYASKNHRGSEDRSLESARFMDTESVLLVDGHDRRGRFVFSSKLLTHPYEAPLALLDGEEFRLFLLAGLLEGPIAQTGYATHLYDESVSRVPIDTSESIPIQQQYVRDHFMHDGRWLALLANGQKIPDFVYAYNPGAPVRWQTIHQDDFSRKLIKVDLLHEASLGGSGLNFLKEGFSHPEDGGTWLTAGPGRIAFTLGNLLKDKIEDYEFVIEMLGRISAETGRRQHCTILVNKKAIAYVEVPDFIKLFKFRMPPSVVRGSNYISLEIIPDHAEPVLNEAGAIIDQRPLSILVKSFGIMRDRRHNLPVLEVGTIYPCVDNTLGARALVHGFYAPESNMTWVTGTHGEIAFKVDRQALAPALHLKLAGRRATLDGAAQSVTVHIGSRNALTVEVDEDPLSVEVPLDPGDLALPLEIVLALRHAEPVTDNLQNIIDPRFLGAAILEVGVVDREGCDSSQVLPRRESFFARFGLKGRTA